MSTTAAPDRPATAKLIGNVTDATKYLHALLDRGNEIKGLRIRHGDELDRARGLKLEWTQDVTDLLNQVFDNSSVADYCNDFVGKIFPEYAEFGNFVEQFYEEMDHRLGRVRTVLKRLEQASEGVAPAAPSAAASPQAASSAAPAPSAPATPAPLQQHSSSPKHSETHMPSGNKVLFVSHGPKDPSAEAVLAFVQQLSLGVLEADHTNGLIDTLEARNDMGFVVVMNGAGHEGAAALSESSHFKLGYCAGKLGVKRMCLMHAPTQVPAAEGHGIAHLAVDHTGGWQLHLARQMKRAGVDVDLNRLC